MSVDRLISRVIGIPQSVAIYADFDIELRRDKAA
jgi:hypothetical protein